MDEIVIKYWSPHGRQEETKFHSGHSKIDLVMRAAKRVDLTDLQECSRLEILDLSNNMLEEINLIPVSNCTTLYEISLRNNHLTALDLWSLAKCVSLRNIDLSENRLHGIDLTPVFLRAKVRMDSSVVVETEFIFRYMFTHDELSKRFHLIRPDNAPWVASPVIIWNDYAKINRRISWSVMRGRINQLIRTVSKEKWFSCQRGLLQGMDMVELSGYDGDPVKLLDTTDANMSYNEARHAIFDRVLELLDQQFEDKGPTLFLEIEKMKNTRASKLIPHIVELRKEEIENITLQIKGSNVFLKPLWLTHYGFTILQAAQMRLITDVQGLELLKSSFSELGLSIDSKIVKALHQTYSSHCSYGMQRYVFNHIRGRYQ